MNNGTTENIERDPLVDEVVEYAKGQTRLTASGISEKFCIGFNRANRIIRQIAEASRRHPLSKELPFRML